MSPRIFQITSMSSVPLLVLVLATSIACARTTGPTALTGELNGEIVFSKSTVAQNTNYLETITLPQEGFIALVDITGWDSSSHFLPSESDPRVIAYGAIDSEATRHFPVQFTIRYDPEDITLESDYAVLVQYIESLGNGKGLTSGGTYYANYGGFGTAPARVLTDGYPRQDIIVRIDLFYVIS